MTESVVYRMSGMLTVKVFTAKSFQKSFERDVTLRDVK